MTPFRAILVLRCNSINVGRLTDREPNCINSKGAIPGIGPEALPNVTKTPKFSNEERDSLYVDRPTESYTTETPLPFVKRADL